MPEERWIADCGDPVDEDDLQDGVWFNEEDDDQVDQYEDDYEDLDDDDYEPIYERDEPNCHECDDQGCRRCEPSRLLRLRVKWWGIRFRLRNRLPWRRLGPDEPPF